MEDIMKYVFTFLFAVLISVSLNFSAFASSNCAKNGTFHNRVKSGAISLSSYCNSVCKTSAPPECCGPNANLDACKNLR